MVLKITEFIAESLKASNPYLDAFAVNCIKIKNGPVVNFIGSEKVDFRPSDLTGNAAYIRFDPVISYSTVQKRIASAKKYFKATIKIRIVVFSVGQVKKLHAFKTEQKIGSDLLKMTFETYTGDEQNIEVLINSSNLSDRDNFIAEIGEYEVPIESTIIAINCSLSWEFDPKCLQSTCDVYELSEC